MNDDINKAEALAAGADCLTREDKYIEKDANQYKLKMIEAMLEGDDLHMEMYASALHLSGLSDEGIPSNVGSDSLESLRETIDSVEKNEVLCILHLVVLKPTDQTEEEKKKGYTRLNRVVQGIEGRAVDLLAVLTYLKGIVIDMVPTQQKE
jgi:hypothetical protein